MSFSAICENKILAKISGFTANREEPDQTASVRDQDVALRYGEIWPLVGRNFSPNFEFL